MLRTRVLSQTERQPARPVLTASLDLAARLPRLILEARRVSASVHGIHGRRRAGPGESFWQYRPLVAGESASRIDWRRSARDGHLFVREREWEASHTVWLWIDRSASMGFASSLAQAPKIDRALVAGFALAETLVEGGERVGHLGLTRPMASRNIIELLAQAIAADRQGAEDDLPPAAPLQRLSDAIIVTDGLSPADSLAARIRALSGSGARGHVLLIADPIEETFPFTGQAELFDLEDGLALRVGDAGSWGEDYRQRLAAHREAIREACRKAGWTLTLHRTDRPASEAVLRVASLVSARGAN
ncbi:DUF58 domain-containing protein [Bosea sp. (in: a-proteobacteria)]|uniref:DUF58 domain-containing protein n=1 Tax=Bosea sp. (in: a-proteobacteria) TaxID=1871050 RepID=UPI00120C05C4|nr:DUF58 domain-containing protein [Bosea sp. (in: a-proteobacteria)]TAJ28530.1 MAG: DUF58 domain-containing protein [Bosea sp. (in: a-proteobacteria)]